MSAHHGLVYLDPDTELPALSWDDGTSVFDDLDDLNSITFVRGDLGWVASVHTPFEGGYQTSYFMVDEGSPIEELLDLYADHGEDLLQGPT